MQPEGRSTTEVLTELDAARAGEPDVHGAHTFGLVYPTGRHDLERLARDVSERYLFSNALNPMRFPEQARLMEQVVDSTSALLHRPAAGGGSTTAGGTESIVMSMLVHRERARARGVERPVIVAPRSAHPAYAKAAHYFDMEYRQVPLDDDWRADVGAARDLVDERTAVVVASAFSYPHGVMDPVAELAALAAENGAGCHVDACVGGMVLPFLERLGVDVPPFDFRVPGVTAMSCDLHKYGYVPKGASVVMHRDGDWAQHQWFVYTDWPSGLYGSPAVAGAKSPAAVMTAWAFMEHLGLDGYTALVADLMGTVRRLQEGIAAIDGLAVVGEPIASVFAFESTDPELDIYAVGEEMERRGWFLNRNVEPVSLHLMVSPGHAAHVETILSDLREAVALGGQAASGDVRYS